MSYFEGKSCITYIINGLLIIFFSNILKIKSLSFFEYSPGRGFGGLYCIADIKLASPYYLKGG